MFKIMYFSFENSFLGALSEPFFSNFQRFQNWYSEGRLLYFCWEFLYCFFSLSLSLSRSASVSPLLKNVYENFKSIFNTFLQGFDSKKNAWYVMDLYCFILLLLFYLNQNFPGDREELIFTD